MMLERPNRIVTAAFYAYVFSLPFEIPQRSIPVEVHTLTGVIFLAIALFQPGVCFRRPPLAFWFFAFYFYVYVCLGVTTEHVDEWVKDSEIYLQVLLLFWVASNVMRDTPVAKKALGLFIAACVVLAVFQRLGIATSVAESGSVADRVTAFGQNPNTLAHNLSFGLLALVGLAYGSTHSAFFVRLLVWILSGLLAVTIMPTAARGALLSVMGSLVVIMLARGTLSIKLRNAVVVLCLLSGLVFAAYRSDPMRNRFLVAAETGDLAQRERLFPAAWQMFLEKPLIGWGPVNNRYEIERHVPRVDLPYRETHNMVLELLTETGLVGALPFLFGIALCLRGAWRGRKGPLGILPLAMMLSVLVSTMATSGLYTKINWLVFSLAAVSEPYKTRVLSRFGTTTVPKTFRFAPN